MAKETPEANAAPGTDNAAKQEQENVKLAGKFNSVEELEKSYANLEKMHGGTAQQLGDLQAQNQEMVGRLSAFEQMQQQQAQPQTDYMAMKTDIARKMDDGSIDNVEGMRQLMDIAAQEQQETVQKVQQETIAQTQQQFQQELAARDQEREVADFHRENPQFAQLQSTGVFEDIKAADRFVNDDFNAYLVWQRNQAFDQGKNAAVKEVAGSEPAENVASVPGSAMKNETPVDKKYTKAEIYKGGLEAFENAGK